MPERGPPLVVARHPRRRTRGLIALVVALTLLALVAVTASAGAATVAQQLGTLPAIQPFNGEATSRSQFESRWSAFHFAIAKGSDSSTGWSAVWAYPNVGGAATTGSSFKCRSMSATKAVAVS